MLERRRLGVRRLLMEGRRRRGRGHGHGDGDEDVAERLSSRGRGVLTTVSLDVDSPAFDADDHLPRCEKCSGCTTALEPLDRTVKIGPHQYTNEPGASPATLLRASSPRARGGWGIAKTWCFKKYHRNGDVYNQPPCDKNEGTKLRYERMIARVEAMQALADECGLGDVSVRHWRERIRSAHPQSGDKIDGDALFMDRAPGVSLEMFTRSAPEEIVGSGGASMRPPSPHRLRRGVLRAIDSRKVLRAVLFDVLLGQCDRHGQNIFVTAEGEMTLIDNDQAFGEGWRRCAVDSVMVPGSEKFTIVRFGNQHLHGNQPPQRNINVQTLLDYRCHAPGGELGQHFPHEFRTCAKWLSDATPPAIADRFGFANLKVGTRAEFSTHSAHGLKAPDAPC